MGTVFVLVVLFVAAFIKSALGFGESLIAMPLLTLLLGIQTASPLTGLVAASLTVFILCAHWQQVDLRAVWQFVLAAAVGTPIGVWGLRSLTETWVTGVLGAILILTGLYNLVQPRLPAIDGAAWTFGFGLVAGVLSGAYNVAGPPTVLYGSLKRWPSEQFKAMLQGFFLPVTLIKLVGHAIGGLWTYDVLRLYVLSVPVVLLAFYIGNRLGKSVSPQGYRQLVYGLLILLGLALVI